MSSPTRPIFWQWLLMSVPPVVRERERERLRLRLVVVSQSNVFSLYGS